MKSSSLSCNTSFISRQLPSDPQLSGQEFLKLPALRELHLGQNYLESIPEGTFQESGQLEKLFLFSNNLASLDAGAFTGLSNLTTLLLNNNLLRIIAEAVFDPLVSLKKL